MYRIQTRKSLRFRSERALIPALKTDSLRRHNLQSGSFHSYWESTPSTFNLLSANVDIVQSSLIDGIDHWRTPFDRLLSFSPCNLGSLRWSSWRRWGIRGVALGTWRPSLAADRCPGRIGSCSMQYRVCHLSLAPTIKQLNIKICLVTLLFR